MRPLSILSNALAQVFYQKACDERNIRGNNGKLVEILMDRLMFIGVLPTMLLTTIGGELFTVIFGTRWYEAGRYAQILAPWLFFWFISSPLSSLFLVYERQELALSIHFVIFITRVFSLYIGGIYQNIYLALGLFSLTGIASYAILVAWNIWLAQANGKKILFNFFKYNLYSLPVLLCLFLVKYAFQSNPIVILLSALLIMTSYVIIFRNKIITQFGLENLH